MHTCRVCSRRGENPRYPSGGTHRLPVDYAPGAVFGELALLEATALRQAGIVATTACTCKRTARPAHCKLRTHYTARAPLLVPRLSGTRKGLAVVSSAKLCCRDAGLKITRENFDMFFATCAPAMAYLQEAAAKYSR